MTKKELSQLYWLDREILGHEKRLAQLEDESVNITSALTGMPGKSGKSDKVGDMAAEIADLKALININIQKRWYEKTRLMRYIMTVNDIKTI